MKQEIAVTALLLDAKNPRMEVQPGHRDAIRALFAEEPKQMLNLAEDIVENGLNPLENIGVSPAPDGRYIVHEGNRRVAALCVLHSPDLAKGAISEGLEKKLRELAKKLREKGATQTIECEVLPAEQWDHWVTLRHTGPNEGRGLVPWGPLEKARYLHRAGAGKKPIEVQFIDWYKAATETDETEHALLKKIPLTSLKRLLDDSGVRKRLGITVDEGLALSAFPQDEMFKWARRVVHDLGEKKIHVRDIYDSAQMSDYLDKFSRHELPDPSKELKSPIPIEPVSAAPSPQPAQKKTKARPAKPWSIRELKISPHHSRLRDIWGELQQLPIDRCPNIHSVMLRVFLEMTVEDYLAHHNLAAPNDQKMKPPRPTLATAVAAATDHLEQTKAMNRSELVPARKLAGRKSPLYSTQSLHQFVHNKNVHPSPTEVLTLWKDLGPFIAKLHER
jgi:hypothetical protein